MSEGHASRPTVAGPWPNSGYAWYVVVILSICYLVSFVDRQILNLLVPLIQEDLGISDTQISLLQGLSFAVFYSFLGIPIGIAVDRGRRVPIILAGIAVWSAMTAICGLSRSYWHLFAARVGVGAGEATLSPAVDYAARGIIDIMPTPVLCRVSSIDWSYHVSSCKGTRHNQMVSRKASSSSLAR